MTVGHWELRERSSSLGKWVMCPTQTEVQTHFGAFFMEDTHISNDEGRNSTDNMGLSVGSR